MLDWKQISTNILANKDDQGKLTQYLTDLETEITTFNTRFSDLEQSTTKQKEQIESLQKTNLNLFEKVSQKIVHEPTNTEKPLTFEELFNEKGELK